MRTTSCQAHDLNNLLLFINEFRVTAPGHAFLRRRASSRVPSMPSTPGTRVGHPTVRSNAHAYKASVLTLPPNTRSLDSHERNPSSLDPPHTRQPTHRLLPDSAASATIPRREGFPAACGTHHSSHHSPPVRSPEIAGT